MIFLLVANSKDYSDFLEKTERDNDDVGFSQHQTEFCEVILIPGNLSKYFPLVI